jgi:hypothetical protein
MDNSIQSLPSSLAPCAFCEYLLDRDELYKCNTCGLLYCALREDCQCRCGIPTADVAVAAAQAHLINECKAPTSAETLVVEDESGVFFGIGGSTEWLLNIPVYEETENLDFCLPIEFGPAHSEQRAIAFESGKAGYLTDNFAVAIKRFDIEGRIFTVSVFHPFEV